MNKLELLRGVIEQFQLSPQDVIEDFVNNKVVNTGFLEDMAKKAKGFEDVTIIPSKKYVTPKNIRAGMFEYASGLIYPELISSEQLRGIVGYADDKEILVWCLGSAALPWSEEFWDAGTRDKKLRGWEATQKVLETAERLGKVAPAAQWCADYEEDGVQKASAFLPSYADFERLMPDMKIVKGVFNNFGLNFGRFLWSSSECSSYNAWNSNLGYSNGLNNGNYKGSSYYVRPVRRIVR